MSRFHDHRFPGESDEYRQARDELLAAEIELRRQVESVAERRRGLPPGGPLAQDYEFDSESGPVRFSGLMAPGHDSLIVYNFMFAPGGEPCPMCTAMLDGLDGNAPHVTQRVSLAVVAKADIDEIAAYGESRGWRHLRLLSSANNSYNRDYFGEDDDGQWPMLNVFTRRDGRIVHNWGSELFFCQPEPEQNPRHVDMIWPLWHLLDLTPQGRGEDWFPRRSY